jgi:hypothetical protein
MIRETGFGSLRKVPGGLLAETWLRADNETGALRPPFARGLRLPGKPGLWAPLVPHLSVTRS